MINFLQIKLHHRNEYLTSVKCILLLFSLLLKIYVLVANPDCSGLDDSRNWSNMHKGIVFSQIWSGQCFFKQKLEHVPELGMETFVYHNVTLPSTIFRNLFFLSLQWLQQKVPFFSGQAKVNNCQTCLAMFGKTSLKPTVDQRKSRLMRFLSTYLDTLHLFYARKNVQFSPLKRYNLGLIFM